MKRLELLEKAMQRANEMVDACSALDDVEFKELNKLSDDDAIEELAERIIIETYKSLAIL